MNNLPEIRLRDLPLRSQYHLRLALLRARYAMLFPARKMTERRRITLADYLGYRDIYQDRDGFWCGKSGILSSGPVSGIWGRLPSDADLVREARQKWRTATCS